MDEIRYVEALLADLDFELDYLQKQPSLLSIFIGGGTPSLFSASAIQQLLDGVRDRIPFNKNIEITMEANPGAVDSASFAGFREAGVNRLSIGMQSFNDFALKALGRVHNGSQAIDAYEIARQAGFSNINLDLMFGLPNQSLDLAMSDVQQAIKLQPEHISYYQLTMEPNTAFYQSPPIVPPDDDIFDIEIAGHKRLAEAGYARYEISAFAQEGKQARHNLQYWHFNDYLGIGAGAHGMFHQNGQIERRWRKKSPKDFMYNAGTLEALSGQKVLTNQQAIGDFLLNNFRLLNGFEKKHFEQSLGLPFASIQPQIDIAKQQGLLVQEDNRLMPSKRGLLFLNDLIGLFFDVAT